MDETIAYVWSNYRHLMTSPECDAERVFLGRAKAEVLGPGRVAERLRERVASADPEVLAYTEMGREEFIEHVCGRILRERADEVHFTSCPRCQVLTRTPYAQQCARCYYDWHSESATGEVER
jgi:hypothetical protein